MKKAEAAAVERRLLDGDATVTRDERTAAGAFFRQECRAEVTRAESDLGQSEARLKCGGEMTDTGHDLTALIAATMHLLSLVCMGSHLTAFPELADDFQNLAKDAFAARERALQGSYGDVAATNDILAKWYGERAA